MKRTALIVLMMAVIFMLSVPSTSFAEHQKWEGYLSFKGGWYWPTGDLQDLDFDGSFSGEVLIGMYINPNLAVEFGGGYFQTDDVNLVSGANREKHSVWVIPVIANIKGVLPLKAVELYGGGGVGLYFANYDIEGFDPTTGNYTTKSDDTVFGGHVLAGLNIDLSKRVFIEVEGRYIFTASARLFNEKVNLDGLTVTGGLGFRF